MSWLESLVAALGVDDDAPAEVAPADPAEEQARRQAVLLAAGGEMVGGDG